MKHTCTFIFLFFSIIGKAQILGEDRVLDKIDTSRVKADIAYLASDELKGRKPGTEGFTSAINYVVRKCREYGLAPKGESESYLQKVFIRTAHLDTVLSACYVHSKNGLQRLRHGKDFALMPNPIKEISEMSGEIAFVGYGIVAPNRQYDDYMGDNVKGKIALMFTGAPSDFSSTEAAHYSTYSTKLEEAANQGAVGVIMMSHLKDSVQALNLFNQISARWSKQGIQSVLGKDANVYGLNVVPSSLAFAMLANPILVERWLGIQRLQLLNVIHNKTTNQLPKLSVKSVSSHAEIISENVVALVPCTDKNLKNEYVIYTAHLDHLGIGHAINGDSIYNGAHDNASGTAVVLELARLCKMTTPLKRSMLFVWVTGEEMGLLGSQYFARFPTVAKKEIVANINIDMPTWIAPLESIVPLGAEHSSLMEPVKVAATKLGLLVENDPMADQARFVRSDQYSFVQQGIPAVHIKYGFNSHNPDKNIGTQIRGFLANVYHKPNDELNNSFKFEAAIPFIKLNYLIGIQVNQNPERPRWNKGDLFEARDKN